jgi:glycerol-3-phosphate acyltransferase PlsX
MRIGIDMMGGDFAPGEAIAGVKSFLDSTQDIIVVAIGNSELYKQEFTDNKRVEIVHTSQIIEMQEHPVKAMREKPDSSIVVGFGLLQAGKIDAFLSAGNTGMMLVGASMVIKPIEGVLRPTLPTIVPREHGGFGLLLDVGLNADCKPENLNQFAILGSIYAQEVLGITNPRVALLNIGEEEGKGNILAQATYPLLKENTHINFVGNIEGRDVFLDKSDVIICEGFTGNIILKMAESLYDILKVKRGISDTYIDMFNYEQYGGSPVLGVNKPVIVGHGISKAPSFTAMLGIAEKMISKNMTEIFKEKFATI